jgi:hypothetical protein
MKKSRKDDDTHKTKPPQQQALPKSKSLKEDTKTTHPKKKKKKQNSSNRLGSTKQPGTKKQPKTKRENKQEAAAIRKRDGKPGTGYKTKQNKKQALTELQNLIEIETMEETSKKKCAKIVEELTANEQKRLFVAAEIKGKRRAAMFVCVYARFSLLFSSLLFSSRVP